MRTKVRLNFTIGKAVASNLRRFCREHGYSISAKVEQAMQGMMKQGK